jgi:integrase
MASIRKRNGRYQVQIRKGSYPLISRTFARLADAKKWVGTTEYEIEHGLYEASPTPGFASIADLFDHYLLVTGEETLSDSEFYRFKRLRKHFGSILIRRFKGSHLARYRDLRLKHIKPATLVRELSLLRRILRIAQEDWDVEILANPLDRFTVKGQRGSRERRLEGDEEERLLAACKAARNPWLLPTVLLALETAMRRGELLNARHEHLKNGLLTIPKTKTGASRTIPLTPNAQEIIAALPRSITGYLIPISSNALRLAWDRARERAGIDDLRFHDLRHEAISRFFEMGLSIPEVALISGHKDYRMLARYTHLRPETVLSKLNPLEPIVTRIPPKSKERFHGTKKRCAQEER